MNQSDAKPFREVLAGVFALYGRDISDAVLSIWWAAMRPYDFAAVKDALNRHAVNPDNGQFIPKPADVVRLIDGGMMDSALLAWTKIDQGLWRVGPHQSIVFDDPTIHAVVRDMGGWPAVCICDEKEWPFRAKEFQSRYRGYKLRGNVGAYPKRLAGIAECHNASRGFKVASPLMVGERKACLLVYRNGSTEANIVVGALPVAALLEGRRNVSTRG